MKHFTNLRWLIMSLLLAVGASAWGDEVTYLVNSKNTLTVQGTAPTGSSATLVETYNTSQQMTAGNSQTLTLKGFSGYTISNITLQMRSNSSKGAGKLSYSTDGGSTYTYLVGSSSNGSNFNSTDWNGSWSTSYVSISKDVTINATSSDLIIKIEATVNSLYCKSYTLTYTQNGASVAAPTTTAIDASSITNTDIYAGTAAGSLSATVTSGGSAVSGATITWSSSDESVATVGETTGVVTLVGAGTTTITASYAGVVDEYQASSATYSLTVTDSNAKGGQNNPFTVAEAVAYINTNSPTTATSTYFYVSGIVSAFYNTSIVGDGNNFRYYISDDGTTTGQLLVYKGKGLNQVAFSSADDLKVGDVVTVCGPFQMYNNTPEIANGNYLDAWSRPSAKDPAGIAYSGDLTYTKGEAYAIPTLANPNGLTLATYTTTDETVATVSSTGVITLTGKIGTATITVTTEETNEYEAGEATCVITVNGQDAGISFTEESLSFTSENYATCTGQILTNPNNLPVTYRSSNSHIATVTDAGIVTLTGQTGSVTITATYTTDNESNYASASASYTITVTAVAINGEIDLRGSTRTLSFTDFSNAPGYEASASGAPFNVDGTMNGVTATYQWTGTNVMVKPSSKELQLKAGAGQVVSWPVKSDNGFRVRAYVETAATGAQSTLRVTGGTDDVVNGQYNEYVLKTYTETTSEAYVTIEANTNALYVKQIDLIPICQDYPNLSLSESSVTVASNETVTVPTLTIGATDYDGTIVWSSSNTTVAEVNASTGAVTIHSMGSAIITATATETDNYTTEKASYILTVNPISNKGDNYFYESFNKLNGSGGRDEKFSGSLSGNSFNGSNQTDETWTTYTTTYEANKCARLGSSKNTATLVSASINVTGEAKLTFSAAGWGDSSTNTLTVSATGGTLTGDTDITLENGVWNNYEIEITEATGELVLTFAGKRGFLDEIRVFGGVISTSITSAEYSTYVVPEKIVVDSDTRVYIITAASHNGVTLSEVDKGTVLPAGEAVVLNGSEGTHTFAPTDEEADALTGNLLQAATTDITCDDDLYGRMYVLNKVNDKVGFYRLKKNSVLVEGRAYLLIDEEPSGEAKTFLPFNFTEETSTPTAIEQPVVKEIASDVIYNLNGQRVTNPTRGLYIIGGKKVFIK
ncbi:MAG: Ig-like domain-containing protein [Bacteroidaceae bacterium]|nr:Ig-like domain-containing protein [Bacteroidaceae bacterium]